jgi:hypothetical protein
MSQMTDAFIARCQQYNLNDGQIKKAIAKVCKQYPDLAFEFNKTAFIDEIANAANGLIPQLGLIGGGVISQTVDHPIAKAIGTKVIPGATAAMGTANAAQAAKHDQPLAAVGHGIGAIGNAASLIPHPAAKIIGPLVGALAPVIGGAAQASSNENAAKMAAVSYYKRATLLRGLTNLKKSAGVR